MEPEGLVYLDEAGMNSQDSDYPYGYCQEGQRFDALKSGKRQGRVSYMAAWCYQQLLAPFTFEVRVVVIGQCLSCGWSLS